MRRIVALLFLMAAVGCGGGGGAGSVPQPPLGHQPGSPTPVPSNVPSPSPTGSTRGTPSPTPPHTATPPPTPTPIPTATPPPIDLIQHIVIIVQENRSFNNLFMNFPGAYTSTTGTMSNGQQVTLAPVPLEAKTDIPHSHINFELQYANGSLYFDRGAPSGMPTYPYAYVPQNEIAPYWTMASNYALADNMFQSNNGPSYVSHQYLIAGQDAVNQPGIGVVYPDENPSLGQSSNPNFQGWGCDDPSGTFELELLNDSQDQNTNLFPCYDYKTIGDELDASGVSWRYYAPSVGSDAGAIWSAFDPIAHIRYGPDWNNDIVSPETQIISDAQRTLPSVTYVVPKWPNSDHSGTNSNSGPSWVAGVVNAIGEGPNWKSTAIFILWDDWGGWYDNVVPPQLDNMGLGFRIPLIVVSPYARAGYVSHVQHEEGSILHFIEERYRLAPMGASDARADDLLDMFNFSQPPRPFATLPVKYTPSYFMHQRQSTMPPDDD